MPSLARLHFADAGVQYPCPCRKFRLRLMLDKESAGADPPRPDAESPATGPRPEDTQPADAQERSDPDAGLEELAALVDSLESSDTPQPAPEDTLLDVPASSPEGNEAAPSAPSSEASRAARFRAAELAVRDLRRRQGAGLLSRAQLQAELRRHMVEDEGIWWMLGVETDTWYRYDERAAGWVIAQPPAAAGLPTQAGADVANAPAAPDETLSGTLPPGFAPVEDELPRDDTPLYDREATIAGMAAIHQASRRLSEQDRPPGAERAAPPPTQLDERLAPHAEVPPPRQTAGRPVVPPRLLLAGILAGVAILLLAGLTALVVMLRYNNIVARYDAQIDALAQARPGFQSLRILSADGALLAELDSEDGRREPRPLGEISPWLIAAVVVSQEAQFYENTDFNLPRIFSDLFGSAPGEATTIAQQLAALTIRNEGVGAAGQARHRNIVAAEIARRYERNTILERYLNEVAFGPRIFGAQAGADFWFGADAGELQPAQAALLAGLIANLQVTPLHSATRDEAFANADRLLRDLASRDCLNMSHHSAHPDFATPFCAHRERILDSQGDFTPAINLQRATLGTRNYATPTTETRWPHFTQTVVEELRATYGEAAFRSGATVHSTLDLRIQQAAADALRDQLLGSGFGRNVPGGVVSVMDPASGALLALAGGEMAPEVGLGFHAPGAALMPLLYAAALEGVGDRDGNGRLDHSEYLTAASILWDVPGQATNPFFPPLPYANLTRGPVSLRSALANALNIPAARVWDFVTQERFLDTAARLGLRSFQAGGVAGLGSAPGETGVRLLELMQAYSTLANHGRFQPLHAIRSVTAADGSELPLLVPRESQDVLQTGVALLLGNLLAEDSARSIIGEGGSLTLPGQDGAIAAIANTTIGARDLWAMGYSNNSVVGVWLGRPDGQPTGSSGLQEAAPVFQRVMQAALQGRPQPVRFAGPQATLAAAPVCTLSGARPGLACPGGARSELFVPGYPPPPPELGVLQTRNIDTWSGLLANEFCPDNQREQTFLRLEPEDPQVIAWLGSPAGQAFMSTAGLVGLPPAPLPSAACDVSTRLPTLRLLHPPHNSVVQGSIPVTGSVAGHDLERFELSLFSPGGALVQPLGSWHEQRPGSEETLVQWNTSVVPDGPYMLRLAAWAVGGGYAQREAFVVIRNAVVPGA